MTELTEREYIELSRSTLSSNMTMFSNKILEEIGAAPTVFFAILMSNELFHEKHGNLTEDRFFYETIEDMEKRTKLTRYNQDTCIKTLIEYSLLKVEIRGLPAKRYFQIQHKGVVDINKALCKKTANREISTTSEKKEDFTVCKNTTNLSVADLQQSISNNNIKSTDEAPLRSEAPLRKAIIIRRAEKEQREEKRTPVYDKSRKLPPIKITKLVQEVLDYWSEVGLTVHRDGTNSLRQAVEAIEQLMNGTLFTDFADPDLNRWKNYKFKLPDIKLAIDNHILRAFNPDYQPEKTVIKEYLQHLPLCQFFYNRRKPADSIQSEFLICFTRKVERISESKFLAMKDDQPNVTALLTKWYTGHFADRPMLKIADKNTIIRCSRKLREFAEEHKSELIIGSHQFQTYGYYEIVLFLAHQLTRCMEKMLRENEGLYPSFAVTWLTSDMTFKSRLPHFLQSEKMMMR